MPISLTGYCGKTLNQSQFAYLLQRLPKMTRPHPPIQTPAPGTRHLRFCGDCQRFTFRLADAVPGGAWLRTNLGRAAIQRREITRQVDHQETRLARDWFDIPMQRVSDTHFELILPLVETGHFEAKAFFLEKNRPDPSWPPGENVTLNVEPADTCCANMIYNAFVRQFGPNQSGGGFDLLERLPTETLDKQGYTLIPPSGTFRHLIEKLDFIIDYLGCRILQLLPIFPTPTTYARMGRFGSPFAALSFTEVDSALAEFDPRATPLEQFIELVDAAHSRDVRVIIDIAINHTGWAARLHETHPEWLVRDPDGRIEVPGAWGVRWEDLTRLDYSQRDLWRYMAGVFLIWCRRGVDGFRCDAGYMIPEAAWEYIVAKVRRQFPDTLFFLEGLGGKISVTRRLLDNANLNWAYSELFQNYDRRQISAYLPEALEIAAGQGLMVHFAETHDNNRLAARSPTWARMRTALCALASQNGAFGFANGVEWYATEKIDVHDAPSLNWGAPDNQVDFIRRINHLLKTHPAFFDGCQISIIGEGDGNSLALLRHHLPSGKRLVVAVNLDDSRNNPCAWSAAHTHPWQPPFLDLLSGRKIYPERRGDRFHLDLAPGQVYCLAESRDMEIIQNTDDSTTSRPARVHDQLLRAKALDVFCAFNGTCHIGDMHPERAAARLAEDPLAFCSRMNPQGDEPHVAQWNFPADEKRQVMVPPGHFLLVAAPFPFRARIASEKATLACEKSLARRDGTFFALFSPLPEPRKPRVLQLVLSLYTRPAGRHLEAPLLYLPPAEHAVIRTLYPRAELLAKPHLLLSTNGRGAMLRAAVPWGRLYSRYDALLAANLNRDYPEDRRIMFTRCRAWLRFQGFSTQVDNRCLSSFRFDAHGGSWHFNLPTGQGQHVHLAISLRMIPFKNEVRLTFRRLAGRAQNGILGSGIPVTLILRPDIEDRNFHDLTKAYTGPEHAWPAAVSAHAAGFVFQPADDRSLEVRVSSGSFVPEPEWRYMVHRRLDAQRGQDPDSDLFSPGYFELELRGDTPEELTACVRAMDSKPGPSPQPGAVQDVPGEADSQHHRRPVRWLADLLKAYVVNRGDAKSVIAGYPWFLDWGRDALIFTRGLIAAGRHELARKVLLQFGRFEENGTLPNMIQGETAANRDTSDAPLWFVLACAELVRSEKRPAFLQADCGGRKIKQVLNSIIDSYLNGTPNGIMVDAESGLVFSPVHFTWMDTNHPAGTPRQGYPIEIQALWYAALRFRQKIAAAAEHKKWSRLAETVRHSVSSRFCLKSAGYFSDCLHAGPHTPAADAVADDALRPNQLLAVTLGAVKSTALRRCIVNACQRLLVPGAIRSLADQSVAHALEIWHKGKLLNDPHHPYRGTYAGDEDTDRKPAYHNGTAWTWLFPSFCEAWVAAYGRTAAASARALLGSSLQLVRDGCVGHIPEILDGDYPHVQRGCDAQAWGLSEFIRVWLALAENG